MATAVQNNPSSARLRAMVVPREHGAWGMLFVPLVTGAAAGIHSVGASGMVALFAVVALSLFWLRTPVESLFGAGPMRAQTTTETQAVFTAMSILGSLAAISLSALFLLGARSGLLIIGAASAVAFVAQAGLKKFGRRYYMAAQLIGSIGLTSTAAAAYYVATGRLDSTAVALWGANWLFAGNQIHYVQLRIHAAKLGHTREKLQHGATFAIGQFAMAAAIIFAWRAHYLPVLAALAFVPVIVRGFQWFIAGPQPLAVKRLGWTEMAHAVGFGVLLIAGFLLSAS
ncbi:MAG: YwiC-like family protein [Terriglobales bacterium]